MGLAPVRSPRLEAFVVSPVAQVKVPLVWSPTATAKVHALLRWSRRALLVMRVETMRALRAVNLLRIARPDTSALDGNACPSEEMAMAAWIQSSAPAETAATVSVAKPPARMAAGTVPLEVYADPFPLAVFRWGSIIPSAPQPSATARVRVAAASASLMRAVVVIVIAERTEHAPSSLSLDRVVTETTAKQQGARSAVFTAVASTAIAAPPIVRMNAEHWGNLALRACSVQVGSARTGFAVTQPATDSVKHAASRILLAPAFPWRVRRVDCGKLAGLADPTRPAAGGSAMG